MQKLKDRLPPLDPLVAFEAAARHLSFTLAARELNLSQAAVSQQIRNLEQNLGVELFHRAHRAVRLSSRGREYQHTVSTILRQLASATADLTAPMDRPRLNIAADQSIATMWLMQRLPRFQQLYPDVAVRLVASDDERDCLVDDIQISIIHGNGDWPGFHAELLFEEEVFPVCSPDYLTSKRRIGSVSDLVALELLELEDNRWDWMNWRIWLSGNGVDLPAGHKSFQINSYPLLIEAAKNGQGLALGWRYLVDNALAGGELVRPVAQSLHTAFGYYFVWPRQADATPMTLAFRDWANSELTGPSTLQPSL